jgi:hypothetical protein
MLVGGFRDDLALAIWCAASTALAVAAWLATRTLGRPTSPPR